MCKWEEYDLSKIETSMGFSWTESIRMQRALLLKKLLQKSLSLIETGARDAFRYRISDAERSEPFGAGRLVPVQGEWDLVYLSLNVKRLQRGNFASLQDLAGTMHPHLEGATACLPVPCASARILKRLWRPVNAGYGKLEMMH